MIEHGMKLVGEVSRDLHHSAAWVRVQVMQIDGIPLSLKAHRGAFERKEFVKGRVRRGHPELPSQHLPLFDHGGVLHER